MKIKELYYVYEHIHPDTGEIVYVGMGTGSRAWASGTSSGSSRSLEHSEWISNLYEQGFTMADIAKVKETLLTRKQALGIEQNRIQHLLPRFNKEADFRNTKFTKEQALAAAKLFDGGVPYYQLPAYFNLTSSNLSVLGKRMVESSRKN